MLLPRFLLAVCAAIAPLVEQLIRNQEVRGSTPLSSSNQKEDAIVPTIGSLHIDIFFFNILYYYILLIAPFVHLCPFRSMTICKPHNFCNLYNPIQPLVQHILMLSTIKKENRQVSPAILFVRLL